MSLSNNFPAIAPSLSLDFANTKRLDPRITFTRTTTATYYDGVTTAKAEENLFLRSQEFSSWTPTRSTVTENTTAAPDGTTTADSVLQAAGQTTSGNVLRSVSVNAGDLVISIFAKPNGKNFLAIREVLLDGTTNSTWFDVSTGAVGTTDAGHTATITASTNSFYRCSIKLTANAARTGNVEFFLADTDGSLTVADDGNGLYLWGAQLEQRSAVTAYTPTTTAPITNYIPVLQTAASGVARFDHNPTTGESLGLLVEEQRTNTYTYSEDFSDAAWAKTTASITSNTIVAPDGTLTGDKLILNDTETAGYLSRTNSYTSGTAYTFSCYAKQGEQTDFRIITPSAAFGSSLNGVFNLSTGTVTSFTATSASITSVGNGWYRCSITATATSTTTGSSQLRSNYTGNGYDGIYIWGAQLEAGAFPTSYIATTSASVTRNADAASMTGTNFSSWFNNGEGALYGESSSSRDTATRWPFALDDGSASNFIGVRFSSTQVEQRVNVSGVNVVNIAVSHTTGYAKTAFGYEANNFAASVNGGAVGTDTSGTIPVLSQFTIGRVSGGSTICGHLRKLAYYPSRLPDAQLQALTS